MAVLRECKIWKWNFCGIDKPQSLGPPVSTPLPVRAPFIIHSKYCLCIHALAVQQRVTGREKERGREGRGKERGGEKKSRRDYMFA